MTNPPTIRTDLPEPPSEIINEVDFEWLYRQHGPFLLRICFSFCKDESLAADMVQEIFCAIWDRRMTLSVTGPWENYLYRCAKFQFYNHQRSLTRFRSVQDDVAARAEPWDDSTREHIEYADLKQNVNELVEQLPDQCRKVYRMSRQQGLNAAEISKELLLSEKTVKNHLTRALGFLRRNLEGLFALAFLAG
ncbi:MAG: RNA polymerase sigma factor [Dyadobacter fermentans]